MRWLLSHGQDPRALAIVDGLGRFAEYGPHYSRRTPGSKSFTGIGQEIVLVTEDECAVWACVYQATPRQRGTGTTRGRSGETDTRPRYLWRNMVFRNLGPCLSSELIAGALVETYVQWLLRYRRLPTEQLRTEIRIDAVKSSNPGYCYQCAGWTKIPTKRRGMQYLNAPPRADVWDAMGLAA